MGGMEWMARLMHDGRFRDFSLIELALLQNGPVVVVSSSVEAATRQYEAAKKLLEEINAEMDIKEREREANALAPSVEARIAPLPWVNDVVREAKHFGSVVRTATPEDEK